MYTQRLYNLLALAGVALLGLAACVSNPTIPEDLPTRGKVELLLQQAENELIAVTRTAIDLKRSGVIRKGSERDKRVSEALHKAANLLDQAWAAFNVGDLLKAMQTHDAVRSLLLELRNNLNERAGG